MTQGEGVQALAEGLWRRLRDVALAEQRLDAFAFVPGAAGGGAGHLAALLTEPEVLDELARDVTLRALALASDRTNYRLLRLVQAAPARLDDLGRALGLPAVAVAERVSSLAQVGLAGRELEHDRVEATVAGRGLVELVEQIRSLMSERSRDGLRELR